MLIWTPPHIAPPTHAQASLAHAETQLGLALATAQPTALAAWIERYVGCLCDACDAAATSGYFLHDNTTDRSAQAAGGAGAGSGAGAGAGAGAGMHAGSAAFFASVHVSLVRRLDEAMTLLLGSDDAESADSNAAAGSSNSDLMSGAFSSSLALSSSSSATVSTPASASSSAAVARILGARTRFDLSRRLLGRMSRGGAAVGSATAAMVPTLAERLRRAELAAARDEADARERERRSHSRGRGSGEDDAARFMLE